MGLLKLTAVASAALLLSGSLYAQSNTRIPVPTRPVAPNEGRAVGTNGTQPTSAKVSSPAALSLREGAVHNGLFGVYDYQSNGMSPGHVWVSRTNPNRIFMTYMLALDGTDSISISGNRRVGYATSTDGGKTWQSTRAVGDIRLGFPYIGVSGQYALIAAHGNPNGDGIQSLLFATDTSSIDFTLVQQYPRLSVSGREGDDGAGVIWPSMVPTTPGKIAYIASLSPLAGEGPAPLHYSAPDLTNATPAWSAFSDSSTTSTSGGNYVMAAAPSGKIGVAYFHRDDDFASSGIFLTESTDGGTNWSTPTQIFAWDPEHEEFDTVDSLFGGSNIDLDYQGETPNVVFSAGIPLFISEGIYHWNPTTGVHRIQLMDSTKGIGVINVPIDQLTGLALAVSQPNMRNVDYPTLSCAADGKHMLCVFQAGAQFSSETTDDAAVSDENGFHYFRLWGMGSNDGGAHWSDPYLIQDFAGDGTDSASIEYPSLDEILRPIEGGFEYSLGFQARRHPGMYAFVASGQSAGPVNPCYQYFQRNVLDESHFKPFEVGVKEEQVAALTASMKVFPNPATSTVTLNYTLKTLGDVTVKIYNSLGVEVATPIAGATGYAGGHTLPIDVSALPAGAYRLVLTQNGVSTSQSLNVIH